MYHSTDFSDYSYPRGMALGYNWKFYYYYYFCISIYHKSRVGSSLANWQIDFGNSTKHKSRRCCWTTVEIKEFTRITVINWIKGRLYRRIYRHVCDLFLYPRDSNLLLLRVLLVAFTKSFQIYLRVVSRWWLLAIVVCVLLEKPPRLN